MALLVFPGDSSNPKSPTDVGGPCLSRQKAEPLLRNAHALVRVQMSMRSHRQRSRRQEGVCALLRGNQWADMIQP